MSDAAERWARNPLYVLELPISATRAEVERAGQKWLAMLELDLAAARLYATPLGPRARTPELVREAMAELREPDKRALHELWWLAPEDGPAPAPDDDGSQPAADAALGLDALTAAGWRRGA